MGLDWLPGNKPKPGFEDEFRQIIAAVAGANLAPADRPPLVQTMQASQQELRRRYEEISISAFETLNAPRVGFDAAANDWARRTHIEQKITKPLSEWLQEIRGYYVLSLVEPCDGIPPYSSGPLGYVERYSFRAAFLSSCLSIIGESLSDGAYYIKFPPELSAYGDQLLFSADQFARANKITIPAAPPDNPDPNEGLLHIVRAAGRWCRYWAERGHFLEPYF